ncbi:MAG: hypothetical protein V4673_14370 [Pseudomonadota bacterium]
MNPRTVLTLADGRNVDLLHPKPSDFQPLDWAAEHLAKENRYNGATPGVCYSVAQHMCECAALAFRATGDLNLAGYLLLHDVHEALFKDDTTPKKRALAAVAEEKFGTLAAVVMHAFDELTSRCDAAVHDAADLPWPPSPEMVTAIKHWDRVLLVTEWRDLMGGVPLPNAEAYADVAPSTHTIIANEFWETSRDLLLLMWRKFLPALQPERV